ncbi:MAG: AAA family ATPase [Bacteroidota bacterium]
MQRILIIGCSGSGKSTLARRLGEQLDLPRIHLDQHYWHPGWIESEKPAWEAKVKELVAQPQWVMDGNYSSTFHLRFPRADTVIFLDMPTYRCFWRILKRLWQYRGRTRPDMPENCPERADWQFWHYVLTYNITRRKGILKKLEAEKDRMQVLHLRSKGEIDAWLIQEGNG